MSIKSQKDLANEYFTAMCLAHEVVIQKKNGKERFQGPSPDEVSLVEASKEMNYEFF